MQAAVDRAAVVENGLCIVDNDVVGSGVSDRVDQLLTTVEVLPICINVFPWYAGISERGADY